MSIDKKFIVKLQGKDFVTYEGLLDKAHSLGITGIYTDIVEVPNEENGNRCIMKASAYINDRRFDGYGDAEPGNVNKHISKHIIRMAETRAKARALRDLTNIGMTAIEELGDDADTSKVEYVNQDEAKQLIKEAGDEQNFKAAIKQLGYPEGTKSKHILKKDFGSVLETLKLTAEKGESA